MANFLLRIWNTVKIPLIAMVLTMFVVMGIKAGETGSVSFLSDASFWDALASKLLVELGVLSGPGAAIDKWLRDKGIYIERPLSGFKLPTKIV